MEISNRIFYFNMEEMPIIQFKENLNVSIFCGHTLKGRRIDWTNVQG